ncbi:MAG: citB [Gammaproteobacteria bacterium]|jgi:DNA-binding CsgD family transcriptional regulator|nr:citB [Gammaproteobacteria bacterium]
MTQNFPAKLSILSDALFAAEGLIHVYCVSKDNLLLNANPLQIEIIKLTCHLPPEESILNQPLTHIFRHIDSNILNTILADYTKVLQSGKMQQFFHIWSHKNVGEIKLLTTEVPCYNEKSEVIGILGISQYITRFHLPESFKEKLSKKQTECVQLLLDNKTTQQIADIMGISRRTVESYLNFAKAKCACHSNAELLAKLIHANQNFLETASFKRVEFEEES